jgi:hypothetical protein
MGHSRGAQGALQAGVGGRLSLPRGGEPGKLGRVGLAGLCAGWSDSLGEATTGVRKSCLRLSVGVCRPRIPSVRSHGGSAE